MLVLKATYIIQVWFYSTFRVNIGFTVVIISSCLTIPKYLESKLLLLSPLTIYSRSRSIRFSRLLCITVLFWLSWVNGLEFLSRELLMVIPKLFRITISPLTPTIRFKRLYSSDMYPLITPCLHSSEVCISLRVSISTISSLLQQLWSVR